ncbi:phage portal protein, partial [Escherichia coli]|nr:phage portal protein [Escherichia coli]EFJ9855897.1 phage portal protein [Escherichia coli]
LALMGDDYQEIFRQQLRESQERQAAGLPRPIWIKDTFQQQIRQTTGEKGDAS